ncbi:MAG: phosphoenolpyruvate carboxykinase (ATP), partial [Saprospiraceae bacterium]|nr:phosphoenolpyruvate carboxykinase (ATP) [Saprospiraceae bacterium]
MKESISLTKIGIHKSKLHYQLSPAELHKVTLEKGMGKEADSGALAINTGEFTGRSPLDRFIVVDDITQELVWWGNINMPFNSEKFDNLYQKVIAYLDGRELYVRDCYACSDPNYRLNIRVVTEYPWSNMFAYNMFIKPTKQERKHFAPEWLVINAPGFRADPKSDGTRQHNFAIINFTKKIILIGGTGYTGEIKKGIFSVLNFLLPVYKNTLPMHCSANMGENGDTAIFFGLSGSGKTTLSTYPSRKLIG